MNAASKLKIEDPMRIAAKVYLEDRAYDVLVGRDEPVKTGELLREVGMDDVTLRTIRHMLATSARFEAMDRRWTLASRIQDAQRPFERIVEQVIGSYGRPILLGALAQELALTLNRPVDYYEEMVPRMLGTLDKFFSIDEIGYGLSSWLVVAESEEAGDVLFDNFMDESDVEPFRKVAGKIKWNSEDIAGSAAEFVNKVGRPVSIKALGFYAWEGLGSEYDPMTFFQALIQSDKVTLLSTGQVISETLKSEIMKQIQAIAAEIEEMPADAEEEAAEAAPVTVSESDRDEIVGLIEKRGGTVSAEVILDSVLEMSPGERGYDAALESLKEALTGEDRVVRVGPDRWRLAGTIPDYINEIPESLLIPTTMPFETPEGDVYDQELEDDGLEAGLKQEMMNPLVQDIGDEDPEETNYQPMDHYQRVALKYHHKESGTMPIIQFNPAFFGNDPSIIQITLVSEGVRREAWINNETRLMYGLKDWYSSDMPVSGAAIEIHKTERPGDYRFIYDNRTDPSVFVPMSRLLELLELKNEADSAETPVFDIIVRILEHYKKGIGFVPLFTEVNLVRRVSRRLVASILSSYHCFHTRGKTGEWQYDIKKRSQGFNKAKRKYIVK